MKTELHLLKQIFFLVIGGIVSSYCQGECPTSESQTDLGGLLGFSRKQKTTSLFWFPAEASLALTQSMRHLLDQQHCTTQSRTVNLWYMERLTASFLLIKPTSKMNVFVTGKMAKLCSVTSNSSRLSQVCFHSNNCTHCCWDFFFLSITSLCSILYIL